MAAQELAKLLRAIADLIERGDPNQIKALREFVDAPSGSSRKSSPERSKPRIRPDLSAVIATLSEAKSRQDGYQILGELKLTKSELSKLGREANIHIGKEANVSALEEKIVEALIGSRLNSQAIRGSN